MLPASTERILDMIGDGASVLDVGGGAAPFNRATHILDALPFAERGMLGSYGPREEHFDESTWVVRDFCDREPWPFEDDSFDFALCVTTLEDIRDPIWVCSEMSRVAKAGYVEVPTILAECVHRMDGGGDWLGHAHHRWMCTLDHGTQSIVFEHKAHSLHRAARARVRPAQTATMTLDDHLQGMFWTGAITAREHIQLGPWSAHAAAVATVAERFPRSLPRRAQMRALDAVRGRLAAWHAGRIAARVAAASQASLEPGQSTYFNAPDQRVPKPSGE